MNVTRQSLIQTGHTNWRAKRSEMSLMIVACTCSWWYEVQLTIKWAPSSVESAHTWLNITCDHIAGQRTRCHTIKGMQAHYNTNVQRMVPLMVSTQVMVHRLLFTLTGWYPSGSVLPSGESQSACPSGELQYDPVYLTSFEHHSCTHMHTRTEW